MASSAGFFLRFARLASPALVSALAYGAYKSNLPTVLEAFFTGPGRTSRIIALVVVLVNWKSLPLVWTFRIYNAMIKHFLMRPDHAYPPSKLFHPVRTSTHVSLLEVDYNVHKSNSTYFADLDVSRTHLVGHLLSRGCRLLSQNASTRIVVDPSDPTGQRPAPGKFGVVLGAVQCSFRRELAPYQRYEMWSRILAWDRKWLYVVTHFVEKGAVPEAGGQTWDEKTLAGKVYASAVSKYVFKLGRLTVHPAVIIDASGLLPERPGGWVRDDGGAAREEMNGHAVVSDANGHGNGHVNGNMETPWDWKRTEDERKKGLEYANHFAALDGLLGQFQPRDGPLGTFALG
ncbi:capsule polysaccharide biosynthesis protein [Nemania sp. FL0916]|nr:capsule polysaccharide biosynthesis protein [Nemania sp. FL0916]